MRDARNRLADLTARASRAAHDTDWNSPSSRAYHDRVERLRDELTSAVAHTDDVIDGLRRARAEVDARAWLVAQ